MEREVIGTLTEPSSTRSIIDNTASSLLSIVERHRLDSDGVLLESVKRLKARAASNQVSLAVLGEFSSGKTTFINSLLNTDILATGILPTTAACTYISYGPVPVCEVSIKDGTTLQLTLNEVAAFSSEGSRSAVVEDIRLRLNVPLLADGLIIVDTPGVNVKIDEHEAITARAIANANACVYLMDARQPGKKTTIDFLRRIRPSIDKFFFVLNRADILDPAEQEEALDFVSAALTNECGISEPKIVLLSSVKNANGEWKQRFKAFEQSLREFMLHERDSVICAELARFLDEGIARSEELLESEYRLVEQELSAHYNTSLPDATEIVSALESQIDLAVAYDSARIEKHFLPLHETVCESLRNEVESHIAHTFTVDGLVDQTPKWISTTINTHLDQLNEALVWSLRTMFLNRQLQVAATVSQLFAGVRWLEQKTLFLRLGFWITILAGQISVFVLESIYGASRASLIIAPFLGATTAALVYGVFYWGRNRTLFHPSILATLSDAGYVHSAIAGGSLYKDAAANPTKANTAPINAGRAVGAVTGNPWFTAAGAAISGGIYGVRLLMDKASGRLDKLRNEIRENVRPVLDDFEKSTKEEGLDAIRAGKEGMISALHTVLDRSMERYQTILDRLLKPHRRIRENLKLRRDAIREDAEQLRASRQVVLDSLCSLDVQLKGASSRHVKPSADALKGGPEMSRSKSEAPSEITLLQVNAVEHRRPLLLAWIGCLITSILLTFVSVRLAGGFNSATVGFVSSSPSTSEVLKSPSVQAPQERPVIDDYSVIRNELSSEGYLPLGDIVNIAGLTADRQLHVQFVSCAATRESCPSLFVFVGSRAVWSESFGNNISLSGFTVENPGKFSTQLTETFPDETYTVSKVEYVWDGSGLSRSVQPQSKGEATVAEDDAQQQAQPTTDTASQIATDSATQSTRYSTQSADGANGNQTHIVPNAGQYSDGQIETDVVHTLKASKALENELIIAQTSRSEVWLYGKVSSEACKELAEFDAAHVQGVTRVHNNLKVQLR